MGGFSMEPRRRTQKVGTKAPKLRLKPGQLVFFRGEKCYVSHCYRTDTQPNNWVYALERTNRWDPRPTNMDQVYYEPVSDRNQGEINQRYRVIDLRYLTNAELMKEKWKYGVLLGSDLVLKDGNLSQEVSQYQDTFGALAEAALVDTYEEAGVLADVALDNSVDHTQHVIAVHMIPLLTRLRKERYEVSREG